MQGTAVVFPNGNIADAMQSFPHEKEVLQHTSAAVFSGPKRPTEEEQAGKQRSRPDVPFCLVPFVLCPVTSLLFFVS